MLPQEKMRWIGQTTYEKYQQRGFPEGCLNQVVLCGIKLEQLPKNFSIQQSRLYECRIRGMVLKQLDLSGCVITDCIFDSLQIESLKAAGAWIHGTVFSGNRFGRFDLSDTRINYSCIQDCETRFLHLDRAILNSAYFYRIKYQSVTGQETLNMKLPGAARDEIENYKQCVSAAIF